MTNVVAAKGLCFQKVCKDPSSLILRKILGSIIAMIGEFAQKAKVFVQIITFNEMLKKNYLPIRKSSSNPMNTTSIRFRFGC